MTRSDTNFARNAQADFDLSDLLCSGPKVATLPHPGNLAVALNLVRNGFAVFPCKPDKSPLTARGFKDATKDQAAIRSWWSTNPDALPALPTGARNGIAVLDLDRHHAGQDGIAALRDLGLDPATLSPATVDTPNAGHHLYFGHAEGVTTSGRHLPKGVDVRGEGGYVIAPGAVLPDGRVYRPTRPLDRNALPAWPAALLPPARDDENLTAQCGDAPPVDWPEVRRALPFIDPDCDRDTWIRVGMALHAASEGSAKAFELWDTWSADAVEPGKYVARSMAGQWRSFARRSGVDIGSLFHIAGEYGWTRGPEIDASDFDDLANDDPAFDADGLLKGLNEPLRPKPAQAIAKPAWGAQLDKTKTGELRKTLTNACIFLALVNDRESLGLRYNLLSETEESRHGEVGDAEVGAIRLKIERAGMKGIGKDLAFDALTQVARQHSYHPIRDYLSSLHHDGAARLDTWLSTYMGAADTPLTRSIGRAFLLGMVARVERPGCKHDHILMLSGKQGIGKSTACSILAGDWFGDNLPNLKHGDTEASRYVQGKWLVEIGELEAIRKAEAEPLKAFISRQADDGRAPYGRRFRKVPRQTVLVGSTNAETYLTDPTGNRRYWPVDCGSALDLDGLKRDRNQLFAEAHAAFRAGDTWHLSGEMEKAARVAQEAVRQADPWEDEMRRLLDAATFDGGAREAVTIGDCLDLIGLSSATRGMIDSKRMGNVLRALGWERRHTARGKVWHRG